VENIGVIESLLRTVGLRSLLINALVASVVFSVAIGVAGVAHGMELELVLSMTVIAMVTGWLLGRLRLPGWLAAIIAILFGFEVIVVRVGQLAGNIGIIARTLIELISPANQRKSVLLSMLSLERELGELWNVVSAMLIRLWDWLAASRRSAVIRPLALALV
jgi:xanthine/uracil/vitamin C permease (AzgA family)